MKKMWEHLLIVTGALTAFYHGVRSIVDAYKYFVQNEKTVKRHVKEGMDLFNPSKSGSRKSERRVRNKAGVKKRSKNLDGEGGALEGKLS
jgi:hypothetical protein